MPSPILTATLQSATLSSASNVVAQITNSYQQKIPFTFDVYEFLRFVVLAFLTAPPNYKWQQLLERRLPAYAPDKVTMLPMTTFDRADQKGGDENESAEPIAKPKLNIKHTLMKWFIDCMTMGALMNTVAFLVLMGVMKGQSTERITNNIRTETIPIIVNSYKIWPVASIVNFAFIPVEKRIVFLSCVGLVWGIYMSLVAASI
ncbi:hypothetical protein OHC33_002934 [Knufia fluminis]|uniref:Uncharacterized protein n=1 Tax=Knufia fluminis TaxID=191047 RepID=A0AAN8I607_9EURO|nr:hypothetical protein OHC33_002934 [Knufia fluminis]